MEDFLSIQNFTLLYKTLNNYSQDKFNDKIHYKKFKKIIGNTMEEVHRNFNGKVPKTKANNMVLHICKSLIDKNMESKFFENESNDKVLNNLQQLTPVVDGGKLMEDDLKIRPVYEKRFDKILQNNDPENLNKRILDRDLLIKKDFNKEIQDYFVYKQKEEQPVDLEKNPKQLREELIIDPDDYLKSLTKHIKFRDVIIDSRDRNIDKYPEPNKYTLDLEHDMYNVISVELISAEIPNTEYIINNDNNSLHFEETNGATLIATIPVGNYTITTLATAIQTQMNATGNSTYTVVENDFLRISEVFTSETSRITSSVSEPHLIFDTDLDTEWFSSSKPASFVYDFSTPQVINKYRFICTDTTGRPLDWVVEVSNNKSSWTTIDSRVGVATTQNVYSTFTLASNALAGRYMRFRITDTSNSVNVHISEMEMFRSVTNRLSFTSDLTGGSGIFNLIFKGRTVNTGHLGNGSKTLFKDNTIGEIIGFNPDDYTDFSSYTSINEVILNRERNVFLFIKDLDNIHTIEQHESDRFVQLTLDSERGSYSFFKNKLSWENSADNEFIYFSDTPISMNKLVIQFKKQNGSLYEFSGVDHSLHLRFKVFNFKNQVIGK